MHRFKASKYKNSTPKFPKKENTITDIQVHTPLCNGNNVAVGAKFIACNIGAADSGKVGVFKVGETGRMGQHPTLAAHGGAVTDLEFSPFYHDVLLTASDDSTVKLWHIPDDGLNSDSDINATSKFSGFKRRPELLEHHTVAESILAVATGSDVQIWDINKASAILNCSCSDFVQSISWSEDGKTIACTTKEKSIKVLDPRANSVVQDGKGHGNHKDSRIVCLGNTGKLVTTACSTSRTREVKAWDQRNLSSCLQTLEYGSSTGILMPFYDADTNLLFLAGKGDSSLAILEVTDGSQCISQASQTMLPDQTKGMGMVPKVCMDTMSCEVDRLMQLCARQLVPIKIEVPRRSHTDFASELFPDTFSDDIVLTAEDWLGGKEAKRSKTSLDPMKRKPLQIKTSSKDAKPETIKSSGDKNPSLPIAASAEARAPSKSIPSQTRNDETKSSVENNQSAAVRPTAKPFSGVRQSKLRHWTGTVLHPSTHITNVPAGSRTVSGACDGFQVNEKYAAIPLSTPGGPIVVVELAEVGRLPTDIPSFQNKSMITDFKWNPFNNQQLAVALDTGAVNIWTVPKSGLKRSETEPDIVLEGHYSKVVCIQFHPLVPDMLASASLDMNVIIWDIESNEMLFKLSGHEEEVLSMAWSESGRYLATVSKDSKLRIYDPRKSTSPINEGPGPAGNRGARILWALDDEMIFVSGFSRHGTRAVYMHQVQDLKSGAKAVEELDNSPATLSPFYDRDTKTVFVTGKGDCSMFSFELSAEDPHLFALAAFKSDRPHQAFSFLPKTTCDVRKVEFARAWRQSKTSMEPISFRVPRVKMEYFQDDIFPDTRLLNRGTMTIEEWMEGANKLPPSTSMRPSDMKPLSEAPKEAPKERKYESFNADTYKTDEEKRDELLAAMSTKLDLDKQLEQDTMEGVDEDEWSD